MKNTLYMKKNSGIKRLIALVYICSIGIYSFAQMSPVQINPASQEDKTAFKGNYDIKMISNVALQPVWIKYGATNMDVVREITSEEQLHCGRRLMHNNDLNGVAGAQMSDAGGLAVAPAEALSPDGKKFQAGLAYTDIDDDMSTFQSSAAFLDFGNNMGCTKIVAAYLYWTASSESAVTNYAAYPGIPTMKSYAGGAVGTTVGNEKVLMKAPGMTQYEEISAANGYTVRKLTNSNYVNFADVTKYLQGKPGGLVTVANVRASSEHANSPYAAWSLVVIYTYPNCAQRTIRMWDGLAGVGGTSPNSQTISMTFGANEIPATGNSISYLGVCATDAEAYGGDLTMERKPHWEKSNYETAYISFESGPKESKINPFVWEQPSYEAYNKKGEFMIDAEEKPVDAVYDGVLCSRISSYSPENGLNGNDLTRFPDTRYTAGFDAHHYKLPSDAMTKNEKTATTTFLCERGTNDCEGGYTLFMTYMAIETQQAILLMDKKSVETSTKPDGEITYELTIKNVGTKASIGTSEVRDTLDKTLDFVPGSVKFFDKNGAEIQTGSFNIINQGADVNEALTFTIPSIAAGDGANANDWITIQFKAKVKGLDRTDIWAYGCNRQVKNKAVVIYKNDAGDDVRTGSNSSGGCDGESVYFYTPVVDEDLEKSYLASHHDTLDLSQEPNAANMSVLPTLRSRLQYHINEIGLSIDANAFTFYDAESGMEVPADAKFDVTLGKIDYLADADLGGGCVETFYFNVKVTKRPSISVAEVAGGVHGQTSYKGREDGSMQVRAFNGNAPYTLKVYDANGTVVYTAGAAAEDYTFAVGGLKAGTYSAAVTDGKGFVASSGTLTIVDPADMVISINGAAAQCKYQPLTLSAEVSGRDAGNLQYVWRKDGVDVSTSQTYTEGSFEEGATYTLFVCDGGGQEVATKAVAAVPTPKIEVIKPDTGCREFFLPKDYQSAFAAYQEHVTYPDSIIGILGAQEVSGDPDIDEADLVLTYYTPKNGDQAQMNIDKIEKSQDLIVRVTAGGLCYHQDTTQVIVKSFQDCYPIVIPAFFSPDDNGINDIFKIAGISDWHYELESPEIVVFDRYGKKVYSGNYDDIKAGWDGKCDGKDLPSGDYWYELTYKTIKPKVGHFTLKRRKE